MLRQVVQVLVPAGRQHQGRAYEPDPRAVIQARKRATIERNRQSAAACGVTNATWACWTNKQRRAVLVLVALEQ